MLSRMLRTVAIRFHVPRTPVEPVYRPNLRFRPVLVYDAIRRPRHGAEVRRQGRSLLCAHVTFIVIQFGKSSNGVQYGGDNVVMQTRPQTRLVPVQHLSPFGRIDQPSRGY